MATSQKAYYEFARIAPHHIPLMFQWLQEPHVRQWWDDGERAQESVARHYLEVERGVDRYVFTIDGRDARYIQAYCDQPPAAHLPWDDRSWGVDMFIVEPALIGRGHGIGVLKAFIDRLWQRGASRLLIDPHPDNA